MLNFHLLIIIATHRSTKYNKLNSSPVISSAKVPYTTNSKGAFVIFVFRAHRRRIWYRLVRTYTSLTQLQNVNYDTGFLEVENNFISFADHTLARHHSNSKKRRHISAVRKSVVSCICSAQAQHMTKLARKSIIPSLVDLLVHDLDIPGYIIIN